MSTAHKQANKQTNMKLPIAAIVNIISTQNFDNRRQNTNKRGKEEQL